MKKITAGKKTRKLRRSDKCDHVFGQIREKILTGEYTGILPGSQILADQYGVSLMTASKAVTLLATEGLVERLPRKGTVVKPRPSRSLTKVAVIVRDISFPLTSRMVAEFGRMARERDIQPLFMQHFDDVKREMAIARELAAHRQVDGAVMVPCSCDEQGDAAKLLTGANIPVVVLTPEQGLFLDSHTIAYDDRDAFRKGTEYLIGQGHSDISLVFPRQLEWSGLPAQYEENPRWDGYVQAMRAAGLTPVPPIWFDVDESLGRREVSAFIRKIKSYSALFLHHDSYAATVLTTLHRQGIHVPGDVSLISYDGAPLAEALDLTTVSVPSELAVVRATEILRDCKAGVVMTPVHAVFQGEIIERGSVVRH
jgi:LacI family transcriptional regulator